MYLYDNYREIKSITDLNVGDIFLFSADKTNLPKSLYKRRMNSEWVIISIEDNKKIKIRNRCGKQIITLSSIKLTDGFIKVNLANNTTLIFKLFFKKRYSIYEFFKLKIINFKKWISLKQS